MTRRAASARAYVFSTITVLTLLTLVAAFTLQRYESQRVDAIVQREQSKLDAILLIRNRWVRQSELAFTEFIERFYDEDGIDLTALRAGGELAVSDIRWLKQQFKRLQRYLPELERLRMYDVNGKLLFDRYEESAEPAARLEKHSVEDDALLARALNGAPGSAFTTPVKPRIDSPEQPERISLVRSSYITLGDRAGQRSAVLALSLIFDSNWAEDYETVASGDGSTELLMIGPDGEIRLGGSLYSQYEFGVQRGLSAAGLPDVAPELWERMLAADSGTYIDDHGAWIWLRSDLSAAVKDEPYRIIRIQPASLYHESLIYQPLTWAFYALLVFLVLLGHWLHWRQFQLRVAVSEYESVLSNALRRLNIATNAADVGLIDINLDTGEVVVNEVCRSILELPASDAPQISIDLLNEALAVLNQDSALTSIQSKAEPIDKTELLSFADGRTKWVHIAISARTGEREISGAIWDVSESVKDKLELEQSLNQISLASESAGIGFYVRNLQTNERKVDQLYRRHYDLPEDLVGEELNKAIDERIVPEDLWRISDEFTQTAARNATWSAEFSVRWRDGSIHRLKTSAKIVTLEDGKYAFGTMLDVTEQVQAQRELEAARLQAEAANVAKSQFLSTMSHELRTPLNAVIGAGQLLASETLNEESSDALETLNRSAAHLLELINDVLDYAKIEAGEFELRCEPFNLGEAIADSVKMLRANATARGLELVFKPIPGALEGYYSGDGLRLRQILMNLVGNAVKFTEKGTITVELSTNESRDNPQQHIRLTVSDTGIGMRDEQQAKLFSRFRQVHEGNTRAYGGTGLGLSISQELAHLMGGDVTVASKLGEGSTFTVDFVMEPCQAPDSSPGVDSSLPSAEYFRLDGVDVLLVDDVKVNIKVAKRLLEKEGAIVATASDGQEAIDWLLNASHHADVVLMDVQMPGMDGLSATRHLRSLEGFSTLPIIAMTAGVSTKDLDNVFEAGMNAFLAKPIDLEKLLLTIRTEIGRNRAVPLAKGRRKDAADVSAQTSSETEDRPTITRSKQNPQNPFQLLSMLEHMIHSLRMHYTNVELIPSKAHIEDSIHRSLEALDRTVSILGARAVLRASKAMRAAFFARNSEAIQQAAMALAAELESLYEELSNNDP